MKRKINIKPFQEKLGMGYCGPASLKMVLDYYGVEKTEDELAKLTKTDKELGTPAENLQEAVEKLGFKARIKNESSFEDIEECLDKKVPVIVDWFTRGRDDYPDEIASADGHYSVVCGLDDEYIYLQDPEIGGMRKMEKEVFERVWFDFEGETIKPEELIIRQIIAIYK
jgi:predicted double-glycine peptidase